MPRKQKQYHFIYKTVNQVNGKYYIGMHSTNDLDDDYIGSGQRLWHAIKKYGKENFKRETLEFLPDRSSLKEREKEIVNEAMLKDEQCMNLTVGGNGGFSENACKRGGLATKAHADQDPLFREKLSESRSESNRNRHKNGELRPPDWNGRSHREETKKKIGERTSLSQKGEKNSQFGKSWIHNSKEAKRVPKADVKTYTDAGWKLGRK